MPQWQQQYGEDQILYIDESGINSNETAEYGWSRKGSRCQALKSGGHGTRLTMIGAVRSSDPFKFVTPLIFKGSCDRQIFTQWLEYLLEDLKGNSKVKDQAYLLILDNAAIHKGVEIKKLAQKYQTRIVYLPTYSPDMNPIEKAWSVLKRKVRNVVSQQDKTVQEALDNAFNEM